eukprot:2194863-Heterocapsa_arctica.AAC.1
MQASSSSSSWASAFSSSVWAWSPACSWSCASSSDEFVHSDPHCFWQAFSSIASSEALRRFIK